VRLLHAGMVMAAVSLLDENPDPSEHDVRSASRATSAAAPGTTTSSRQSLETDAVEAAFAAADTTVKCRYVQPRLIPNAMEPRGVVARQEPNGDVTMWSSTQIPHILKAMSAATLGFSEAKLRVIAPDVGGGFGSKLDVYAEEAARARARAAASPAGEVDRGALRGLSVATIHGRDFLTTYEFAATKDGKILGRRAEREGRDGRVPAVRHARHPASWRVGVRRPVRHPELLA
jgi:carbon-monoxide dehydrogenase large subunit